MNGVRERNVECKSRMSGCRVRTVCCCSSRAVLVLEQEEKKKEADEDEDEEGVATAPDVAGYR